MTGGMHLRRVLMVCLLLLTAMGACSRDDRPGYVAWVGDRTITPDEFRERAARLLRFEYAHLDTLDMQAKRQLLDDIIAQELVVMEGLRRGLQRDSVIAHEVSRLEQRALIETLYARQAEPSEYSFTESELGDFYRRNGYDERVLTEQIVCATEDSARQALDRLRSGDGFPELVPLYSLRPIRRKFGQDGNIGWFLMADMLPALQGPVSSMEIGDITSEPVQSQLGYHIFRLNDRRSVPLDSVRSRVLDQLRIVRQGEDRLEYVRELRQRYELTPHPRALTALNSLPDTAKIWSGADSTLFSWNGGRFTATEYMALHRLGRVRHPSSLSLGQLHRLVDNLAGQQIMKTEARRLGYDDLEAIREPVRRKRNQLIAEALFAAEGQARAQPVTKADVDAYLRKRLRASGKPVDLSSVSPSHRNRARRQLETAAEELAMDRFIEELKAQYEQQILINEEALGRINLER